MVNVQLFFFRCAAITLHLTVLAIHIHVELMLSYHPRPTQHNTLNTLSNTITISFHLYFFRPTSNTTDEHVT